MKILVIVNPTSQTHADIDQAAEVAQREGGTLELFVCNDEPGVPLDMVGSINTHEYREILRARTLEALDELARPLRRRGLVVTTSCQWHASREEGIFQHILQGDADLLAYGGSLVAYAERCSGAA